MGGEDVGEPSSFIMVEETPKKIASARSLMETKEE
jgi:hypothetical protein